MGVLIDGAWRDEELPQETGRSGEFRRVDSRFRDRVSADVSRCAIAKAVPSGSEFSLSVRALSVDVVAETDLRGPIRLCFRDELGLRPVAVQ